jgi:tetratricopeptide (TPR) repeat protein
VLQANNEDAWFNRGIALAHLKRYQDAIASFEKTLKINPNNADPRKPRCPTQASRATESGRCISAWQKVLTTCDRGNNANLIAIF